MAEVFCFRQLFLFESIFEITMMSYSCPDKHSAQSNLISHFWGGSKWPKIQILVKFSCLEKANPENIRQNAFQGSCSTS